MPWEKGQSGNPKGRPKKDVFIQELAQAHTEEAIKTLALVMRNGEGRERVAASIALLDRGWGKPAQQQIISGDQDNPLNVVSKIERIITRGDAPN